MTTSGDDLRYYPFIDRNPMLVDQTDRQRYLNGMEHPFDGSPFNVYDHNGRINKALPLTFRPPANKVFPGFRGDVVSAATAPTFYDCDSCFGNLLMNPWNPLARPS